MMLRPQMLTLHFFPCPRPMPRMTWQHLHGARLSAQLTSPHLPTHTQLGICPRRLGTAALARLTGCAMLNLLFVTSLSLPSRGHSAE